MQDKNAILYKYRAFDDAGRNIRTISHAEFWFASAKSFNDPFDSAFNYNFDGLHAELAEKWARSAAHHYQANLTNVEKEHDAMRKLSQIRSDPNYLDRMYQHFIEESNNQFGICSFAGSKDNLLLWAHYAAKHTGFCVGLSESKLISIRDILARTDVLLDLREVKYSREMPNPNFFEAMLKIEDTSDIDIFITTKSMHWSYEEERRLLLWDKVDIALPLGHEAIQEVILGCKISPANKQLILSLCREHVSHAVVLQAMKAQHTFSITFEQIA